MTDWSEEETDGSEWVTGAEEEEVVGGAAAMWAPRGGDVCVRVTSV